MGPDKCSVATGGVTAVDGDGSCVGGVGFVVGTA